MDGISAERRIPNALKALSAFLALALAAGLCSPALVLAASATVNVPSAGEVEVSAPNSFANAEILNLSSADESDLTAAVVAEGTLSFYAAKSGTYEVTRSGNDVWSLIDNLGTTSSFAHISKRSVLSPQIASTSTGGISSSSLSSYTGYEDSSSSTYAHGTQTTPIRALAHFVSSTDAPSGSVELSLVAANALLGSYYDSEGKLVDFDPTYLVVEDRDEDTGRLLASVTFSPETEGSAASEMGGADAFNLVVNPSEDLLRDRLAAHSAYESDTAGLSALVSALMSFESSSDAVVLAGLDSMAAYSTGAKEFTLDIVTLSGGIISAGDTVSLKYAAAGADANAHTLNSEQEALLADTYVQELEVDEDGYVSFTLLGGGIYLLGNDSTVQSFSIPQTSTSVDGGSESESASGVASNSSTGSSGGGATVLGSGSSASAASASGSSSIASADSVSAASSLSSDTTEIADSDLFSTLSEEGTGTAGGDADGGSSGSSLSSWFTDESGNLNVARIVTVAVLAACLAAACTIAGIILYRRSKDRKEQELAAAAAAQAAEEERKALEQMSPAERGQLATAAAATAAASAAKDGMGYFMKHSSSEKIEETVEQKVKRKVRARTGAPSQRFVEEDASVRDILDSMLGQAGEGTRNTAVAHGV